MIAKSIIPTTTALGVLCSAIVLYHAHAGPVAKTGVVSGTVAIMAADGKRKPAAGVVVYFEAADALTRPTSNIVRKVSQRNKAFKPELTVIPKGGVVEFPNDDRVFHNVFSLSKSQRFDLGLYRDGDSRSVTFKRPGVVDVYCNIHPEMKARVKIVPNTFYAVTDDEGRFSIADVPLGTYTLVAWNGTETHTSISIKPKNRRVSVNLALSSKPKKKRHLRKDGTPYRRYR